MLTAGWELIISTIFINTRANEIDVLLEFLKSLFHVSLSSLKRIDIID